MPSMGYVLVQRFGSIRFFCLVSIYKPILLRHTMAEKGVKRIMMERPLVKVLNLLSCLPVKLVTL